MSARIFPSQRKRSICTAIKVGGKPGRSDEFGAFSLDHAEAAFQNCGRALAVKQGYHNFALMSTVLPCATRYRLLPILEKVSGKTSNLDFGLCYSPQFVALGSVIHDFLNPDFVLIGENYGRAGADLEAFYTKIMPKKSHCLRMSIENAELTKIAINTFITTKIAFANMIADLCERIPDGDIDVVSTALGMDHRIGRACLTGS